MERRGRGRTSAKAKKRSLFASSFFSDLRRVRLFDLEILLFFAKGVEKKVSIDDAGNKKMKKFPLSQVQKWTQPGIVLPFFPYRENERGLVNSDLTASRRNSGGTKNLWVSPLPASPALAAAGAKEEKIFAPATFFASFFYDAGFAEETRK